MLRSLLFVSLLGGTALADPAAQTPATPVPPAQISIEVTDASGGAAPTTSFVGELSLAFGECGSVEAGSATAHYGISVCYQVRGANQPVTLSVGFDRTVHGRSDLHQKVQATSPVVRGQRVVIGRFGEGGDVTEIAATVK
jgi:hypothetical protein